MKIFLLLLVAFSLTSLANADEVKYHFQEGFERGVPVGWTGNTSRTGTYHESDPTFPAPNLYGVKFDKDYENGTNYLQTPSYSGAGILSFYITRAAVSTFMDLTVYKIVDGNLVEVYNIDTQDVTHKNKGWDYIAIKVNTQETVSFRFAATVKDGNTGVFVIDDMELTQYSNSGEEPGDGSISKIVTNFSDGTWGTPAPKNPDSGAYTDSELDNGFILTKANLVTASANCPTGIKHTNRIAIDKNTVKGSVEFPLLKDIGELEIHAQSGSPSSFKLQEYIGNNWSDIGVYTTIKENDSVYVISLNRTVPTKLRIVNNTGSILLIYQITTTTYKENQELNLTGSTPAEDGSCYYNLTKAITLKFNKDVVIGSGNLLLNGEAIPVTECTIDGKLVSVPVTLEGTPTYKSYKMIIPRGAFLEKDNEGNVNNEAVLNFKTNRTIGYPATYASQIDVVYSNANVDFNRLDIYYPTSPSKPVPLLINIHGGGWNHGEKEAQSGFNSMFELGMAVANIEYRMTPQATAPAAVVDARSAMMYLLENAGKYNIDVKRIVFQGSSAGAHLALTAGYLQKDSRYDIGCNYSGDYEIVAVVDKSGPANVEKFLHYKSLVNWLGEYAENYDFMKTISPVHLVNSGTTPPTYIMHGNADAIVEYEQSQFLVEALEKAGITYQFTTIEGGGHGGFTSEEYAQIDREVTAFLSKILFSQTVGVHDAEIENKCLITIENNNLNIHVDGEVTTEVFDISGRLITSARSNQIVLEESGFFIVKVNTGTKSFSQKIIK